MLDYKRLYQIVPPGSSWKTCPDGFLVQPSGPNPTFRSNEELAKIDTRLPAAIRFLEHLGGFAAGNEIVGMVQLWQAKLHFNTLNNEKVAFTTIGSVDIEDTFVKFNGTGVHYKEHFVAELNESIKVPYGRWDVTPVVTHSWLTENYPGWRERYDVAQQLGFDFNTAVQAMVYQKDDVAVSESVEPLLPQDFGM